MKILVRNALIFSISVFLFTDVLAQTTTTNGNGTDWNTSGNWTNDIPDANDALRYLAVVNHDMIIDAADDVTAGEVFLQFDPAVDLQIDGSLTLIDAGFGGLTIGFPALVSIDIFGGGGLFATVDVDGELIGQDGAVFATDPTGTTINGTFTTIVNANDVFVPVAIWGTSSIVNITDGSGLIVFPVAGKTGLDQDFATFNWNCTGQTVNFSLARALSNIEDLNFLSTGSGTVQLKTTGSNTLTIGNDFTISGSSNVIFNGGSGNMTIDVGRDFVYSSSGTSTIGSAASTTNLNVTRDVLISNGAFRLAITNASAIGNINVGRNFTQSGTSLITASSGTGTISFTGVGAGIPPEQIFDNSAGGSITGNVNFLVPDDSILEVESNSVITGSLFTVAIGGTLFITGANGLDTSSGIIQTSTQDYQAGSNLIYNGTVAQNLGDGFPILSSVNLTIDNNQGVTNDLTSLTIAALGTVTLADGSFSIGDQKTVIISGPITTTGGAFKGFFDSVTDLVGTSTLVISGLAGATITGGLVFDATDNGN